MRFRSQKEVLLDVMLSAWEVGNWLTLDELNRLTHYPQVSISAHLRALRSDNYLVDKRVRESANEEHGTVWEYRVMRPGGKA